MLISPSDFQAFEAIVNEASNPLEGGLLSNKPVIWKKLVSNLDNFNEDGKPKYISTTLVCIPNYNYMRTWPITNYTETGELDKQSVQLLFNKKYLKDLNLLTLEGFFDYNPDHDKFIMDGLQYNSVGDTAVSSSLSDDLFISVIVKRDKTPTGVQR